MNGSITYDTRRPDPLGSGPVDNTALTPTSFTSDNFSPYHDDNPVLDFFDDDAQRITSVVAAVFAIHFALIMMLSPHFIMPDLLPDEPEIVPVQIVSFDPTPQAEPEAKPTPEPDPEVIRPAIPAPAPKPKPRIQPTPPPQEPKEDIPPVIAQPSVTEPTPEPTPEPIPEPEPEPIPDAEPEITPPEITPPEIISQPVIETEPTTEPEPIAETPPIDPVVTEPVPEDIDVPNEVDTEIDPIPATPLFPEALTEPSIIEEPIVEEPLTEEPLIDESPADEPPTDESLIDEPLVEEPAPFTSPTPVEEAPQPGPIIEDPLPELPLPETPSPITPDTTVPEEDVVPPTVEIEPDIIETSPSPETIDPPDVIEDPIIEPDIVTTAPSILASPDAPVTPQETERAVPQSQNNPLRDLLERPVGNIGANSGQNGATIAGPKTGGGNETIPGGGTRRAAPGTSGWTMTPSGRRSPGAGYDGLVLDIRCREANRTHLDCPEYLKKFRGRDATGFESFKGMAGRGTDRGPQAASASGRSATAGHVGGGQNIWVVPLGDNSFNNGGPSTTILDDGPEVSFDREFLNKPVRIDNDQGRLRDLFTEPDGGKELPDWMLPETLPDPEPENGTTPE